MVEGTYALASTNGHPKQSSGLSHQLLFALRSPAQPLDLSRQRWLWRATHACVWWRTRNDVERASDDLVGLRFKSRTREPKRSPRQCSVPHGQGIAAHLAFQLGQRRSATDARPPRLDPTYPHHADAVARRRFGVLNGCPDHVTVDRSSPQRSLGHRPGRYRRLGRAGSTPRSSVA